MSTPRTPCIPRSRSMEAASVAKSGARTSATTAWPPTVSVTKGALGQFGDRVGDGPGGAVHSDGGVGDGGQPLDRGVHDGDDPQRARGEQPLRAGAGGGPRQAHPLRDRLEGHPSVGL
ncbi:hypothetical protein GCM10020219_075650 [Nonomuraea dietziae]